MSRSRGNVKMAVQSLRMARWRSWLTMLGIIVGIVSVVTIVSIGEGIKHQISGQITRLGTDLLTVRPGTVNTTTSGTLHAIGSIVASNPSGTLTSNDLQIVRNAPGVATTVPFAIVPGSVQVGRETNSSAVVIGTTSDLPAILHQTVQYGSFFTPEEYGRQEAVIGNSLALALFQTNAPLGQSFTFHGQQFLVAGVMNAFNTPPLSFDTDFNNAIFIPYPIASGLEQNNASLYEILAKADSSNDTTAVQRTITERLQKAHGGAKNFSVLTQSQTLAVTGSVLNLLTSLVSGIAAISLLVGGIGIMNVMLVSVTERTREVGIRKAIGATNRQIRSQFLIEAVVLSLVGSLAALAISVLINLALRALTDLEPALSWQIMALSAGIALAIGVLFGLAPAVKAARKDPIQALRNE